MPQGRKPLLTQQECADIRDSYFRTGSRETSATLGRLYRVSPTVILRVLDGRYTPSDAPDKENG